MWKSILDLGGGVATLLSVVHGKGSLLSCLDHAMECVVHGCDVLNRWGGGGGEGGGGGASLVPYMHQHT